MVLSLYRRKMDGGVRLHVREFFNNNTVIHLFVRLTGDIIYCQGGEVISISCMIFKLNYMTVPCMNEWSLCTTYGS